MKRLPVLFLFVALTAPTTTFAWTAASDQKIAARAAALAPADLKLIIDKYDEEYQQGLERAEADEGSDIHHYFPLSRSGKLRERIEGDTAGIIRLVRTNAPMSQIVERLGILAHLVADANNPFHVSHDDPRLDLSHNDFEAYFERRMARFPTVFYGVESSFQLSSYLDQTFARTSGYYPLIAEEYFRDGDDEPRTSADFDDRSTAFGVASVCYSHAVTDLVNLYYYIWREAGGDVRSATVLRPAARSNGN